MNFYDRLGTIVLLLIFVISGSMIAGEPGANRETDLRMIKSIFDEALLSGESYQNLDYLCNNIGNRLSGSESAARAVEWTRKLMENYKFDRVFLQNVMVPHWERGGKETAQIVDKNGNRENLRVLALGGSAPTPEGGIPRKSLKCIRWTK